jgi:pyruvate/2-oxoglutarate dehydrogenase complex dihydrolipoamide acyltransferase (E2) component
MKELETLIADRKAVIDSLHRVNCSPTVVIDMDAGIGGLLSWLDRLNGGRRQGEPEVALIHAVMKAAALSLREHPLFNCAYNGRYSLLPSERIDICTPVTLDLAPAGGGSPRTVTLFVVLPATDTLGIRSIAREHADRLESVKIEVSESVPGLPWHSGKTLFAAAASAMDGLISRVRPHIPSWENSWMKSRTEKFGTFMLTDVSGEGITACHGQLAKPYIAGLTTLAVRDDVHILDGRPEVKKVLPLVLEFDHKLTDAGASSRFLTTIRRHLEDPETLA